MMPRKSPWRLIAGAEVIGINNRDLHTFVTDLATTESLAPLIPPDKVIVSESGIGTPADLARPGTLRRGCRPGRRSVGHRRRHRLPRCAHCPAVASLRGPLAMPSPVVKICGVRRLEGTPWWPPQRGPITWAWSSFRPPSPDRTRRRPRDNRRPCAALGPGAPGSVGLFGDQPLDEVMDTIAAAGLEFVQLCGDEPLDYCRQVMQRAGVIKVLHVPDGADDDGIAHVGRLIDQFAGAGCTVTLDSQVVGLHGGTGQSFDWNVAAQLAASGRNFLLAGGLTPDNVAAAIAAAQPWGVDVSSGVENGWRQRLHQNQAVRGQRTTAH